MKNLKFALSVSLLAALALFAGCGKNTTSDGVKVNYYIDEEKTDSVPDRNFYEAVSIESNSSEASIVWDCETWSLQTANTTGRETVNVYFTKQTKPVTVDGIGFDTLQDAFNYCGTDSKKIYVTKDFDGAGNTAQGSDIVIELGGFTIDGKGLDTIINNGKMAIYGEGTITNSVDGEYSKTIVNYGELLLNGVKVSNSTNSVAIWNSDNGSSVLTLKDSEISHSNSGVMTVVNSGTLEITSGSITGCGDSFHPTVYNNKSVSVLKLTGGSIENSADGYAIYNESGAVEYGAATFGESYNMPEA